MASPILYQNPSRTITVIDIPSSLEHAQVLPGYQPHRRILSTEPLSRPFPSVEPKSAKALASLGTPSIEELLLEKFLQLSLEELRDGFKGPWFLPRVTGDTKYADRTLLKQLKRVKRDKERVYETIDEVIEESRNESSPNNPDDASLDEALKDRGSILIPPDSSYLHGTIAEKLEILASAPTLPNFDLIALDPPWPNRSVRRSKSYELAPNLDALDSLLRDIPIVTHLAPNGRVAVWITNKCAVRDLLLREGGVFDAWNVTLVEEWVWLKVTAAGEEVCPINSRWRKPYEILLVARRREDFLNNENGNGEWETNQNVTRRVIVGVPDIHSRKPNLRSLFADSLPTGFRGLEIFARNLTAGWWSWGNEVLKFQAREWWKEDAIV